MIVVRNVFQLKFGKAREFQQNYQRMVPLVDSGLRDVFTIVV